MMVTEEMYYLVGLYKPAKWFGHCIFLYFQKFLISYFREDTDAFTAP